MAGLGQDWLRGERQGAGADPGLAEGLGAGRLENWLL